MDYEIELLHPGHTSLMPPSCDSAICYPRPATPLPWSDCYHALGETAVVRVPTGRASNTDAVRLRFDEMARHLQLRTPRPSTPSSMGSDDADHSLSAALDLLGLYESDSKVKSRKDIAHAIPRPHIPLVKWMSYDLTAVRELADPRGFFEELSLSVLQRYVLITSIVDWQLIFPAGHYNHKTVSRLRSFATSF